MSGDEIELETDPYGGMEGSEAISAQETTANSSLLGGDPCPNGDCTNTSNPAEEAWVKLVSAVPRPNQVESFYCVAGGTAAPSQEEVQALVSQIRPANGDQYALSTLADKWSTFIEGFSLSPETAVEPILRSKLEELSSGWQGSDFDAFAEQMETVFANCEQISADIGTDTTGMIGLLRQKGDEIYALQGGDSHELPYPAPQYWTESEGNLFSDPKIHIRPPFTHGECEIASGCSWDGEDDSTNRAMELGGFDGEYANELNQYVTDQTERHYTRLKAEDPEADESALRQEAERLAEQDGNDRAAQDYEESDQDYQARATEQNDTVLARWEDAETAGSEFSPTVEPSRDTTFRESSGDLDSSGYSPPSGGDFNGSPSGSGTTGLNNPDSTGGFGGSGGLGGNGGGSSLDTGGSGLDSDNPWGSYAGEDPDDVGGGLASGTGGGTLAPAGAGASTGLGTGAGAGGVGTGAGASTGLFGSPSGGAGAGRGMAAGAGKGGMGAGRGASSSMMGGGRGAGGRGPEDQEGRETWLTEDEDVWGLHFDPENDPYV